jgi:two-component system OmpR family sensor kinase
MGKQRIKFDFLVHDLKVPLAVIEAGLTSLIQKTDKYGPLTDKQLKVLKRALRNTLVTRTLVNDALELGRSSQGIIQKTTFPLSGFVVQTLVEIFDLVDLETSDCVRGCDTLSVLKEQLSEKGILLTVDERLWHQEVSMDESKMKQIIRNLLSNALKYKKKQVELKIGQEEDSFVVIVGDDGDGIPSGYHDKIFECYFQMDMQSDYCVRGHGVGLAGVMILVEDMGGRLFLESDVGKGATFSVKVPL